MTLDEAMAAFERTLQFGDTDADEAPDVDFGAIRAAVKDVALAALEFDHAVEDDRPPDERICVAGACGACAAIDEIKRLFDSEGGTG